MNSLIKEGINSILFDLDGTLIILHDNFIPEYIKLLSKRVSHLIKSSKFIAKLIIVSKKVEENDGSDTNENVYAKTFFPAIGFKREELEPIFDQFYEEDFSKLKEFTTYKPEAREAVKKAAMKGYELVIATTPILPRTAILQRMEWAGVADVNYRLITSYENMRATKPNLFYFKQILEEIGRKPEECLMVGNEEKDMVAAKLGIKTFFIENSKSKLDPTIPEPNYRGTLNDLIALL
ncbi:MAG: HAD family hydrolase [Promethearchaeota archaeon]